jgi:hypothetical protein
MTKKEERQAEVAAAKKRLLAIIKPGDTVKTVLISVSRSGMFRWIKLLAGNCENISGDVSTVLGERWNNGAVGVAGCGMDMGFSLVYNLGRVLFPGGFTCLGKRCRANDHSNGDRNFKRHHHNDSGYALRQEWI